MTASSEPTRLTPFQIDVAQRFFSMPESNGFLLAGGAGLLAQHLTHRPTQDLDFFTRNSSGVPAARDAFEVLAEGQGWTVQRIHDAATFCRIVVTGDEALLIDLAVDSPPQMPPSVTFLGPTFAPAELAARKVLALFDRAEARDFADVYELIKIFDRDALVAQAAELDLGFTTGLLAESMGALSRFADSDLPMAAAAVPAVRQYFDSWRKDLLARRTAI